MSGQGTTEKNSEVDIYSTEALAAIELARWLEAIEALEQMAGKLPEEAQFQRDLKQATQNSLEEDKESDSAKRLKAAALKFGYTFQDDMPRDGNCFFHGVVDQLKDNPDLKGYSHEKLRTLANGHIKENYKLYEKSIGDYKAFLEKSGVGKYADNPQIVALSRALKITIVLVQNNTPERPVIIKQTQARAVVYLGYQYGIHYQSLIPERSSSAQTKRETLEELIQKADFDKPDSAVSLVTDKSVPLTIQAPLLEKERKIQVNEDEDELVKSPLKGGKKKKYEKGQKSPTTVTTLVTAVEPIPLDLTSILQKLYREHYATLPGFLGEKGATIEEVFVNLSIIQEATQREKEQVLKKDQEEKEAAYSAANLEKNTAPIDDWETIYANKQPIPWHRLFIKEKETLSLSVQRLLILGRAGIGKSSLSRYLAYQWANEKKEENTEAWQSQFDEIWLLPLRQLSQVIIKEETYKTGVPALLYALYYACLNEKARSTLTFEFLQTQWSDSSKRRLLILDGYDEVAHLLEKQDWFSEVIRVAFASDCCLIVTSRPYAVTYLSQQHFFDQRLEILGFTDDNIKSYITRFMTKVFFSYREQQAKTTELLETLKANPSVWSCARIPINLALITMLSAKAERRPDEKLKLLNLTCLYQEMVICFLRQPYFKDFDSGSDVEREREEYKPNIEPELAILSHIAFQAMQNGHLLISPKQMRSALKGTQSTQVVSLLQLFQGGLLKGTLSARFVRLEDPPESKAAQPHTLYLYPDKNIWYWGMEASNGLLTRGQIKNTKVSTLLASNKSLTLECEELLIGEMLSTLKTRVLEFFHDFYFIHLSFQEYLAAFYLAKGLQQPQSNPWFKEAQAFIRENRYVPRYEAVWGYLSGLVSQSDDIQAIETLWTILIKNEDLIGKAQARLLIRCWENGQRVKATQITSENIESTWQLDSRIPEKTFIPFLTAWLNTLKKDPLPDLMMRAFYQSPLVLQHDAMLATLKVILKSDKEDVRKRGIHFIGQIEWLASIDSLIDILVELTKDAEDDVRLESARVLSAIRDKDKTLEKAISALLNLAEQDKAENVRKVAVQGLSALVEKTPEQLISPVLLKLAKDKKIDTEEISRWSLVEAPLPALTKISSYLHETKGEQKSWLESESKMVVSMPEQVLSVLLKLVQDKRKNVPKIAAQNKSIPKKTSPLEVDILLKLAESKEWHTRREAANKFGLLEASEQVLLILLNLIEDEERHVCKEAAKSLHLLCEKSPKQVFLQLIELANKNMVRKSAVAKSLSTLLRKEAPKQVLLVLLNLLLNLARDEDPVVRRLTVSGLIKLVERWPEKAIDALHNLAEDKEESVRASAVKGLSVVWKKDLDRVLFVMHNLVEDKGHYVRYRVAQGLSIIASEAPIQCLPLLLKLAEDKEWQVRQKATKGLSVIAELSYVTSEQQQAINVLLKLATDKEQECVSQMAIEDLSTAVGKAPKQALPILLKLVEGKETDIRIAVTRVLRAVGEKEPDQVLPGLLKLAEDKEKDVRIQASKGLMILGGEKMLEKVLPDLSELVEDKEFNARIAVIQKLKIAAEKTPDQILLAIFKIANDLYRANALSKLVDFIPPKILFEFGQKNWNLVKQYSKFFAKSIFSRQEIALTINPQNSTLHIYDLNSHKNKMDSIVLENEQAQDWVNWLAAEAKTHGLPITAYDDYYTQRIASLRLLPWRDSATNTATHTLEIRSPGIYRLRRKTQEAAAFTVLQAMLKRIPKDCLCLEISDNGLTDIVLLALTSLLPEWGYLQELNLSHNLLTRQGLEQLLKALQRVRVVSLNLSHNRIFFTGQYAHSTFEPLLQQTALTTLDLSMNYIPPGYLQHNEEGIPLYRESSELKQQFTTSEHHYCTTLLETKPLISRYHSPPATISLISENKAEIYPGDDGYGVVSLLAFKTSMPGFNEHALLMIEYVSNYGQRVLLRADLVTPDGNAVVIRFAYFSPEDYLTYSQQGKRFYYRSARIENSVIQQLIANIVRDQNRQGFPRYGALPSKNPNIQSCLTWAIKQLVIINVLDTEARVHWGPWLPDPYTSSSHSCSIS